MYLWKMGLFLSMRPGESHNEDYEEAGSYIQAESTRLPDLPVR
jgi:hypothetical protein